MTAAVAKKGRSHAIEMHIRRIYRCPECGEVRMFVCTGLVCPNGCGKIVPVTSELRFHLVRRKPVRYADPIRGSRRPRLFQIDGLPQTFRLAPRGNTARTTPARAGSRIKYFVEMDNH